MRADRRKPLGQSPSDEGLDGEVGDRDGRAVVLRECPRNHFALNAAGQERRLANGVDGELGFGGVEHGHAVGQALA